MMKNRHFFYIAVALCCTAFFGACNKDNDFVDFGASIASYGNSGSKVYVDGGVEGTHFAYWHDGDTVMINGHEYYVTLSTSQVNNQNQTIAAINGVSVNSAGYYAIYPCDKIISSSTSGYPTILLPQVQIYRKDVSTNKQIIKAPMVAYSSNTGRRTLNFTNLCSLIEVTLPEAKKVAYIQVTSNNHYLWGEATISSESTPSLTISDTYMANNYYTDNHTVILDCSTNGTNGSNGGTNAGNTQGPFYVVVPANNYENLKVEVYIYEGTENNPQVVKRYSAEATVPAGSTTVNTNIASNMIYHIAMPNSPETVQPSYPGLGVGEFSVSATKKVRFSQGNLQYLASKGMWRFAPNQWDIIGNAAGNTTASPARESQNAWIDLFGFGTSGQGNPSYSPTLYGQYHNTPSENLSASNSYDWGVNEICNGGNQHNKWRTLTSEEWQYLTDVKFNYQHPRHAKQGLAKITIGSTEYYGFILMPDNYTSPYNVTNWTLPNGFCTFNAAQWVTLSNDGCVFIPCSGYRSILTWNSNDQGNNREDGFYWSSTINGNSGKYFKLSCNTNYAGGSVSCLDASRYWGLAVRLVRDVD